MNNVSNNSFHLKPAVREAIPVLVGLWGPSGCGKTLSALKMARGLVGPMGKVALIDTERGRALSYADQCQDANGTAWLHMNLAEPYTPERYKMAFKACEEHGVDVVIIDSMSHVWEGEGGVIDQAMANNFNGLAKWQRPKLALKDFTNYLLKAPFHVIYCLRAKEKVTQKGGGKQMEIIHDGLTPICEKNFIYEMTLSALIGPNHMPVLGFDGAYRASVAIPQIKAPEGLTHIFKANQYITEDTGTEIAKWVNAGALWDKEKAILKRKAEDIVTQGLAAFENYWQSLSVKEKKYLNEFKDDLKAVALKVDEEKVELKENKNPFATNTTT